MTIYSLSFFSGCLGLDLGLEKVGIKNLLYCENDYHCKNTIKQNRPKTPVIGDILNYSSEDIKKISKINNPDLIIGGPPCQAFSTAGKRKSFKDPRGNIFLYFIKIITDLKPKYFIIENVRGFLSAALKHRPHNRRGKKFLPLSQYEMPGGALNHILNIFSKEGYKVSFNLYNSANFGSPQKRERVIIIGNKFGEKVRYLEPTHSENGDFGLKKWISIKEVFKKLDEKEMEYVNFPKNRLKYFKMLKEGENWRDLPNEKIKKEALGKSYLCGGGRTGFFRRLSWNKPSPTLVTHPAMPATDLCHPIKDRPLSVQEYMRIQQIPDNWKFSGNVIQKYRQIGNAVPQSLGIAIGKTIINHFEKRNFNKEITNFKYSRYKFTDDVSWVKKFNNKKLELF